MLMAARSRSQSRFLPTLECLEGRLVPTVTYHGGALLPHVEVQGLYLGSDWYNNSTYYNQTSQFEAFNLFLPQSSYMDLLTQLDYGVGRGSTSPGTIDLLTLNKSYYLTDSTIRSEIQRFINAGYLQPPDANRLYVVYVEPGVAILNDHDHNSTSTRNFAGYHAAFAGRTASGYGVDIHYAVIAYSARRLELRLGPKAGVVVIVGPGQGIRRVARGGRICVEWPTLESRPGETAGPRVDECRAGFHVPRCSKALHIGAPETLIPLSPSCQTKVLFSAGATFYIVDASNNLMKALTTFAVGRAAVEIN
jgi:hypothetical protein